MSIITLFNPLNPVSALNAQSGSYYSESEKNISEKFKNIKEFEPPLDFTTASNWCHYGSLELYYEYGFKKVYQTYPYDGSAYEKNLYRSNSSQVDNYIFDKLYPKSTGYAQFFAGRFASAITSISNGGFKYYISNKPEYITTFGGPNTASAGMEGKPLSETFDDSNKYDVALRRESNLEFDFSYGNTIEFWMNKGQFPNADGREVIFDLSNGNEIRNPGRLTIELDPTNVTSPFEVTIESGSTRHLFTLGSDITTSDLRGAGWHHYAFAFASSSVVGEETRVNFFYDGNLVETQYAPVGFSRVSGALKSRIGALLAPTTQVPAVLEEYGQFSGSLDEFRYWKYDRPADLVKLNYFKGVDGGTNTDDESYQLGVYYKFNEGITQTASVDSVVLDYSGRISNGVWTGYGSTSRDTGSAITLSGIETEVGDPIVRSNHPTIISDMESLRLTGSSYDQENNTYFYNLFPQWIRDEDLTEGGGLVRELAHIGASYFDTIHHQIRFYKDAKNAEYLSSSAKPITFADTLVENMGLTVPNLFINPKIYEKVLNQDENELYDMTMFDVKNQIYHNIYNNIQSILKSKGTVDAMRNFLRSFGVNEEIVKLKMYTDKDTYFLNDNYKLETRPVKFANFSNTDNINASIIHKTPTGYSDINYVEFDESGKREKYSSFTAEANIMFPRTVQPGKAGHVGMNNTVSSLFGFHRPDVSNVSDYTWRDGGYDLSNLQVYAVKSDVHSKDVKFQLKDNGISPVVNLISPLFQEVYDNTTWNISIRMKPSGSIFYGYSNYTSIAPVSDPDFILEFYGTSYLNGEKQRSFHETQVLNTTQLKNLMHSDKRFYVGAHRENFTGSVLEQADTRVSAFRFWHSHLSNTELDSHARDITSYGVLSASQNTTLFEDQIETYFPKMDSLALNWNFELVTGSDSTGTFPVNDISSGSAGGLTQYGWHSASVGLKHGAQGFGFAASSSKVVDKDYVIVAKNPEPGNALLDDMINIRPEFREAQTDYNDVTDNFFSIEKSPYAVLTTEMLKLFSLSRDLNYLVGNPSNRYRMEYKELGDLRDIYFRNIENEPDVERFFDYYKWIDLSLNKMINQLIPFSTRHSENVSNIVESHLLERPKYRAIMPLLEEKSATEGAIQGFTALNYSWPTGHAPAPRASTPTPVADRNLSFLRFDPQSSNPNVATLTADWSGLGASESIRTDGTFQFSFWLRVGNTQPNTAPLISFKDNLGRSIVDLILEQNTTNTDSANLVLRISEISPAGTVVVDYGDTSPYQQNSILEGKWRHVSIFVKSNASSSIGMEFKLYLDGTEITAFGNLGSTPVPTHLILPHSIEISQVAMSVSLDEFVLLHRPYHSAIATIQASILYNNGRYLNVVEKYNDSSATTSSNYLLASWRFGDEEGNRYFPPQASNYLDGQQILDVTPNSIHLSVRDADGSANILQGALTGPPFDTGAAPLAPGSTTGAGNPNVNCFWQKARKERTGDTAAELAIADEREALRKVINDVDTLTTSSLYHLPTETVYDGATFVRNRRNKPYKISINAVQNIHGGINYANLKDVFTFHEALQPHGELGASPTSVPQNVIGVGMDVIAGSGDGIVSPVDCDDNILTKVNFSSNATLGKFYGEDYREKIKGHTILPMNLKNEVVQTGYNSKVNNFYRFDVVFTNLHTDIVDGTNTIPFQGPFTQAHVGGHQSRHVPINRFDDSMPSAKQLEVLSTTGGSQATALISFILSDISHGDTITLEDSDGTSLVTTYSSNYDIQEGKWTSPDELIHIIETRLDITVLTFDLDPVQLNLVQNAYGTDGNKTISTSNSAKITIDGFVGGASPGTVSTFQKVDSRKTRPEAWGLLLKEHQYLNPDPDGAFGFVGADYGPTYPYVEALRATRFRDEHVKRPISVRNIPHDTSSGIAGNYDRGLDIFQLSRDGQFRWYRDAVETAGTVLPATIESSLPNTTHYHTLISQRPVINGPVFSNLQVSQSGGPSTPIIKSIIGNNRYGESPTAALSNASLLFTFDVGSPPQPGTGDLNITLQRDVNSSHPNGPDKVTFRFDESLASGIVTVVNSEDVSCNVRLMTGSWLDTFNEWDKALSNPQDASGTPYDLGYNVSIAHQPNVGMFEFGIFDRFFAPAFTTIFPLSSVETWNDNNFTLTFTSTDGQSVTLSSLIVTTITTQAELDTLGTTTFLDPIQDWDNQSNNSILEDAGVRGFGDTSRPESEAILLIIEQIVSCINSQFAGKITVDQDSNFLGSGLSYPPAVIYDNSGAAVTYDSNVHPVFPTASNPRYLRLRQATHGKAGNTTVTYAHNGTAVSRHLASLVLDTSGTKFIRLENSTAASASGGKLRIGGFIGGDDNMTVKITDTGATGTAGNLGTLLDIDSRALSATGPSSNNETSIHPVSRVVEVNQTSEYVFNGGASTQTGVGNIITTPQYAASNNSLGYEYTTPSSFEINTRFSAPGGPEIQTTSYLDAQSQTYSAYNALPYRNLTVLGRSSGEEGSKSGRVETIRSAIHVQSGTLPAQNFPYGGTHHLDRRGLRTLRQQRMGKSGTDHESSLSVVESADYPTIGSYHNTPANRSFTSQIADLAPPLLFALGNACSIAGNSTEADCIAAGGTWGPVDFQAVLDTTTVDNLHDNEYVSRPIPSQDYGYSWIASLYAQLNGDMDETTTVARLAAPAAAVASGLPAQRTTNFTPYEYNTLSRVSLLEYSAIYDAADQNAASLNTFFKQISEGYEALTNVLPEIDQYANANGTTEIYDPVLEKRIITSAHYFPTISDVSCCWPGEGNLNPVITVTVPAQVISGQPTEFTEDFELDAISEGSTLFTDNTPRQIYEADLRKILLDVEVNACCTEPPQYIMHISGLTLPQPSEQGAEVVPVTTGTIPDPQPDSPMWSTQKPDIFSQTDSDGDHISHDIEVFQANDFNLPTDFGMDPSVLTVYVQIFVKDCEDRISELTITITGVHHS